MHNEPKLIQENSPENNERHSLALDLSDGHIEKADLKTENAKEELKSKNISSLAIFWKSIKNFTTFLILIFQLKICNQFDQKPIILRYI